MTDPEPAKPRRLRLVLTLVGVALVLLAGTLWLNRKGLAREALTGWLKSKGVAAQADIEAFGPTTFTARLRVGDPRNPDFSAEQAVVRYRLGLSGLQVQSVTLRRPVLRASLHQGRFSLGALDPLVQEFLRLPPPTGRQPSITVENGVLLLATDYGPIRLTATATVDDSKLVSLAGTAAPTHLKGPGLDAELGAASVTETTRGGRIIASLDAPLARIEAAGASANDARLQLKLEAPYPDLIKRRGDGPLVVSASVAGRALAFGGRSLARAQFTGGFVGQSTGWVGDLAVSGRATGDLRGEGAAVGASQVGKLSAAVVASDIRWTRKGGDRIAANLQLTAAAADIAGAGLKVSTLTAAATGPMSASARTLDLNLTVSAVGRGGWNGLGAPAAVDDPTLATLKRAARAFSVAAPAVTLATKGGTFTLGLPKPLRLVPDSGGAVEIAARAGAPLLDPDGGAFTLTLAGGGLPTLNADIARLNLIPDGVRASGHLRARGALGIIHGGELDVAGRLQTSAGGITVNVDRCSVFKAERLELGANDVERLAGQLCPAGGPLFAAAGGDWKVAGRILGLTAAAPFAQARVSAGGLKFTAASRRGALSAQADVLTGQVEDTAPATRFNPFALTGHASLGTYVWTADLAARQPGRVTLGQVHVIHDGGLGVGFATLETDLLTFVDGGLQPTQLSPLASTVGSPVTGQAQFKGRFDWARMGAGSSGAISLRSLNFQSPVGRVEGLDGELIFSSLSPLVAAPGQTLDIGSIQAIVPLTHLHARFSLRDDLLKIEGGEALVGGGRIRIESLEAPLTPGTPSRGVLIFEAVQLHDLVEASPFGDNVDLDARVSGRIAFEANANRVRISEGELKAIQPGRLSINRAALTGVQADGAIAAPAPVANPNETFTDFAYQAMENLAFDKLEATIASRPDGRLGVLFHIVGRHDPPTKQRIRISVMDLIQKRFMGKKLPLPSGTQVNLTLDTTLNLDDLLADYADFRRLHGSGPVQP